MIAIDFYFVRRSLSDVETIQPEVRYEDKHKKLSEDWRSMEPKLLEMDMRLHGAGTKICCSCKTSVSTSFVVLIVGPLHIFALSAVTKDTKILCFIVQISGM